jgi:hypothetical protein
MFRWNGNVLKLVEIESQGGYEGEWFCFYRYKEEYELESNKKRWTNPEDRWYEDYMTQKQILQAIEGGAEFIDKENQFKVYNCEHEWITVGDEIVCNKCCMNKKNI